MRAHPGWRSATVVLWWRSAIVAALLVAVTVAAACSGPRSGASAMNGVAGCAAVLPLARSIVHDEGTLTMIRRISRSEADALSRRLGATPPVLPPAHSGAHGPLRNGWPKTCLVVYRGDYPAGTIAGASAPALGGHYALLLLRVRHPSIDRILVTDQVPPGVRS